MGAVEYAGCRMCAHRVTMTCAAYPRGIPLDILSGQTKHVEVLPTQEGITVFKYKRGAPRRDSARQKPGRQRLLDRIKRLASLRDLLS